MSGPDDGIEPLRDALRKLIGKSLSSVEFVQDYLQLHFDGATLTAYTTPMFRLGSRELRWEDAGYGDAFRSLVGAWVRYADVAEEEIILDFDKGQRVSLSLKDEDYRGPEAFEFRLSPESAWIVG